MKDYRVDFVNPETGRRNHKDFVTLKGAKKFIDSIGRDDYIVKQYNPWTCNFESLPYETIENMIKN